MGVIRCCSYILQLDGVVKDMQLTKLTKNTQFIGGIFGVFRRATIIYSLRKAKHCWFRTKSKIKRRLGILKIERSYKRGHSANRGDRTDTVHLKNRGRRRKRSHVASRNMCGEDNRRLNGGRKF